MNDSSDSRSDTLKCAMEWGDRGNPRELHPPGIQKRPEVAGQLKLFAADTPVGRVAEPEEMVSPTIFLSGRAVSWYTGVDLLVDGGRVCW